MEYGLLLKCHNEKFIYFSGCSFEKGGYSSDVSNSSKMDVFLKMEKGDYPATGGHQPENETFH